MSNRRRSAMTIIAAIIVVAACRESPDPTESPTDRIETIATLECQLAPIARQVRLDIADTLNASDRGDAEGMRRAANQAQTGGSRIIQAVEAMDPQPSPSPGLTALLSVAFLGQQIGLFFGEGITVDRNGLASFAGGLKRIDQSMIVFQAELRANGIANC
jgi:hypothetical protein